MTKKKSILLVLVLIIGIVAVIIYQKASSNSYANANSNFLVTSGNPMISAHRAGKSVAPENTLMAIETSITATDFKVDILEFDLQITKDKELILLHDDSVDRTSNAVEYFGKSNNIPSELTYAELRELNMAENFKNADGEYPYRGLRGADIPDTIKITSLKTALRFLLEKDSKGDALFDGFFIIEIKDDGDLGREAAAELYQDLEEFGIKDRTIIATFNKDVTKYFDEHMSDVVRSASYDEATLFVLASKLKIPLGTVGYKVLQIPMTEDAFGMTFNLSTKKFVDYAHKYGIAVHYWTINRAEDMAFLKEIGADALITDAPDLCYKVFNGLDY